MTFNMTRFLLPECIVCLCPFEDTSHYPRVLDCGHSLCEECIGSLISTQGPSQHISLMTTINESPSTNSGVTSISTSTSEQKRVLIRCPECSARTRLTGPGVQSLPKNIELMRLVSALTAQPSGLHQSQSQSQSGRQAQASEPRHTEALPQPPSTLQTNTITVESDTPSHSNDDRVPFASDTCAPSASSSAPHPQPTSTPDLLPSVGSDSRKESDAAGESSRHLSVVRGRGVRKNINASLEVISQPCTKLLRVYEGHRDHVSALAIAGTQI